MNIQEFKYWLQGFKEAIDTTPTLNQWKKILEMIDKVSDKENDLKISYPPSKRSWEVEPSKMILTEPAEINYKVEHRVDPFKNPITCKFKDNDLIQTNVWENQTEENRIPDII